MPTRRGAGMHPDLQGDGCWPRSPGMTAFIDTLLYVLLGVVFLVLAAGIYALFRGGEFGRTWSNRLMRARVLFQFIAVIVIVVGFWAKSQFS